MKRDRTVGCTGCCDSSVDHRDILHYVRHRGIFHHLCTSCVLKFHPGSFCPNCLDLFERSPPSDSTKCSKCTSIAHSACVRPETAVASCTYICPICSNPSFSFFDPGAVSKRSRAADGDPKRATIDLKSAKTLLAAARIAAVSMCRAATSARSEAERKVREAAFARKRVREALERATLVASKKELKGKEAKGVSNSARMVEQKKNSKGNSAVADAVAAQKRIQGHKLGGYSPASLSHAGVGEKERRGVFQTPAVSIQRTPKKGVSVQEKDKLTASPSSVLGRQLLQNHANIDEEKEKIRTFSRSSVVGQQQSQNGGCLLEEENVKSKGFTDSAVGTYMPLPPNEGQENK